MAAFDDHNTRQVALSHSNDKNKTVNFGQGCYSSIMCFVSK